MYGYVIVNKPELKFKEYDRYRSYYCGLCDILREQYGIRGQVSLSYDMTFLVLLLDFPFHSLLAGLIFCSPGFTSHRQRI